MAEGRTETRSASTSTLSPAVVHEPPSDASSRRFTIPTDPRCVTLARFQKVTMPAAAFLLFQFLQLVCANILGMSSSTLHVTPSSRALSIFGYDALKHRKTNFGSTSGCLFPICLGIFKQSSFLSSRFYACAMYSVPKKVVRIVCSANVGFQCAMLNCHALCHHEHKFPKFYRGCLRMLFGNRDTLVTSSPLKC